MTTDPDLLGRVIDGRYRVVDRLGRGGMGSVFRVQHVQSHEWFALKVLHDDVAKDRMMVERFVREARAATAFRSKHVVKVVDAQRDHVGPDGRALPYLVMELLTGKNLEQVVSQRGPLPKAEVAWMFHQLGKALDAAHEHGIVHRDLKPENVFLALDEDGDPVTKVCDFGIAKLVGESAAGLLATGALDTKPLLTGGTLGTPMYMSPEQIRDASTVDARTDQWALGLIAFKALSGREYFSDARSSGQLIAKILADPIVAPSLKEGFPELGEAADAWFLRSCAREARDRWPNVGAQVAALRQALAVETLVPMTVPKGTIEIESAVTGARVTPSVDLAATPTGAPSATTNRGASETTVGRKRMMLASLIAALTVAAVGGAILALRFWPTEAKPDGPPAASTAPSTAIVMATVTATVTATATAPPPPANTASASVVATVAAPSAKPAATVAATLKPKKAPASASATPPAASAPSVPTVKAKLPTGAPCTRGGECASGYCFAEQCH